MLKFQWNIKLMKFKQYMYCVKIKNIYLYLYVKYYLNRKVLT